MPSKAEKIEERIKNLSNFYDKLEELIDSLPAVIPDAIKDMLQNKILGDEDLKKLMEDISSYRPPRILLIGRTGSGKSSLINAIFGTYMAEVNDIQSQTDDIYPHSYKDGDRVLMEILDTRGIAESESLKGGISAEQALLDKVGEFLPDAAVLVLNSVHRDDVDKDVIFINKITAEYEKLTHSELPVIVAVNKCDEVPPSRCKLPSEYTDAKIDSINKIVTSYKQIIINNGLKLSDITAVSSLMEWQTADGIEVNADNINNLPQSDRESLQLSFDGRYNIDVFTDMLKAAIKDPEASRGLLMAVKFDELVKRIASRLTMIFSNISAAISLTPIPVADIYVLLVVQSCLVALISILSGRDATLKTAGEFIFSLAGVTGAGFGFRLLAHQSTKLLNGVFPAAGSTISAAIAFSGTKAMGDVAALYYIDGISLKEAQKILKQHRKQEKPTKIFELMDKFMKK